MKNSLLLFFLILLHASSRAQNNSFSSGKIQPRAFSISEKSILKISGNRMGNDSSVLATEKAVRDFVNESFPFVNVKNFGAVGDDIEDDAPAIQAALDYAIKSKIYNVYIPPNKTYRINTSLKIKVGELLFSQGAVLDFSTCIPPAIIINSAEKSDFTFLNTDKPTLDNLYLLASPKALFSNPINYKKGAVALEFNAPGVGINNCLFVGFDQVTKFKNNAYMISFRNCGLYFNNIGFSFDLTSYSNSGERINFENSSISNNNYGIYNNLGLINISNCSIDYNLKQQIKDNITELGGQTRGCLRIANSHIERMGNQGTGPGIINHGYLVIENSNLIYDNSNSPYIINNGSLYLSNNYLGSYNNYYLIEGNMPELEIGTKMLSNVEMQMINKNSTPINGDFETGIGGWIQVYGNVSIDNQINHSGKNCVKISSYSHGTGLIKSKPVFLAGINRVSLSYWANFKDDDVKGINYCNLKFFDDKDSLVGQTTGTISVKKTNEWVKGITNRCDVPKLAKYAIIELQTTGIGNNMCSTYFDDVYLFTK